MEFFKHIDIPSNGERIVWDNGQLKVPNHPIIPFIEGDGIGPEITASMKRVVDFAVKQIYGDSRSIVWIEVLAGEKSLQKPNGTLLPQETLEAIQYFHVAIKGPLTTPVGKGHRSINVTLRQTMDLYACIRPVRYFEGVPSPVKHPERVNMIIFRENTEDVYAGIEWDKDSKEADMIRTFLANQFGTQIRPDSGIGIKPISESASKRLIRKAIRYAVDQKRHTVTLVHKGNIQKYTEGAFRTWGYDLARAEFSDLIRFETEENPSSSGSQKEKTIKMNDRITDNMFQEVLIRPAEYDVLATTNLNGDYLSDALAAQVGGLGIAPGANIGDHDAVFEATHGTAPTIAGKNIANPGSILLSAVMMLDHIGWQDVGRLITKAYEKTVGNRQVTVDLASMMEGTPSLSTTQFTDVLIKAME